jgi:hypothetical protein
MQIVRHIQIFDNHRASAGKRTCVILILEDESGLVPGEGVVASEAAHDGEVAQDVVGHSEEAVAVL